MEFKQLNIKQDSAEFRPFYPPPPKGAFKERSPWACLPKHQRRQEMEGIN